MFRLKKLNYRYADDQETERWYRQASILPNLECAQHLATGGILRQALGGSQYR